MEDELQRQFNLGVKFERERILGIIDYVDMHCFDPNGSVHEKFEIVKDKIIGGKQ